MVTFLRRLFIKDYKNVEDEKVRTAHGKLAACVGICSNLVLFVFKILIGIITASVSIIGDAINNLSDLASSILSLLGFKLASKPADAKHPFGHQRIEYIIGLLISVVIIAIAVMLFYTSLLKVINNEAATYNVWAFVILGAAIIIKVLQGLFYLSISKTIDSVSLKASAQDSINDVITTSAVLIAAIIAYFTGWNLDGWFGMIVALFICYSGIRMIFETSSPLLGESTAKEKVEDIIKEILSYKGVLGVHDVMCHNYGPTKIFMTAHVEVDCRDDILEAHDMIDNIEKEVGKKHRVVLTIHMDPVDNNDEATKEYKEIVNEILTSISPELSFHDFRIVGKKTTSHINLIFDVVMPFKFSMSVEELKKTICDKVHQKNKKLNCVIDVDRPFVE